MTTERAIEVLMNYNKWLNIPYDGDGIITDNVPTIDDFQQALCKAIEVMKEKKECQHPYHMVHTRCMGEINRCLQCGEDL